VETVKIDLNEVLKVAAGLRRNAQGGLVRQLALRGPLYQLLIRTRNDMQQLVSGPVLQVRTGALRASLQAEQPKVLNNQTLVGRVGLLKKGPAQKYGHFLVKGGRIKASGKYLAIPVGPARTAAGVPRYRSPRQISDLFFIRSKKGNLLLVRNVTRGRGKKKTRGLVPYFVLKRSVFIGPHDYVSGPRQKLLADAQKLIADQAAAAITAKG